MTTPHLRPRAGTRVVLALLFLLPTIGLAQAPVAAPSGISPVRLQRLTATMKRYVDEGRIAGTVTMIVKNGQVAYLNAQGKADIERNVPMRTDSIFRIASQSKAVTSVAVMMLMEEGLLLLNDPVSKHLPAFAKTTVWTNGAAAPARRQITIRDLLTHTAGISYGASANDRYSEAGFDQWYFAHKAEPIGPWMEKLATIPFDAQPGEAWVYGFNTDILGYVVEKVSGLPLDRFFQTRIFEPLKMHDTAFFLPPAKRDRLTTVYGIRNGRLERAPDEGRFQGAYVDGPRAAFSGGAGLLSTASDYARFLQMLLNGGQLDGVRLLSPRTVELMSVNHVGNLYQNGRLGFGLGFEITEDIGRAGRPGSNGEYGWGGAYNSRYWVDPKERMVVVFLSQLMPTGGLDIQDKLRALVSQALE